ncbi:phosphoglycerate dehydrogenase [Magnetovibrio sp. PR-2]|uniref:phosphoglycerate dehydrogenase n=1 Tax=Magnetovibrio sp. PR-2 TaxID=3120356 RepID=UPI002FCE5D1A
MVKVLISDKMSPRAEEIFKERGVDVDYKPGMTPDELKACIGEYDGLAIRSATKATADIIDAADNLKVIGRAGIGTDNIDKPAATSKGIVVMNTPFGNAITTAEHAITLMMATARQIPAANASTHASKWEKSRFMGVEVMGKTLGLIGAGNIGSGVAERAIGLKMKVVAYDPYLSPERAQEIGVEKVELDDLFKRADFISLHTPMTDSTRGIVNKDAFAKMKDGVRIVNCARGGLVVEADLLDALESGKCAGAALDVFEEEPAKDNALFGRDDVICTPHLGASTSEAQVNVAVQIAEQISDYLLTGAVTNALNMPSVSAEDAPKLAPYLKLAEQLGSFAGQVTVTGIEKVEIEYEGHAAELNTKPITAVVLQGLLSPMLEGVNMVSAPVIAKDRDIDITEILHERPTEYQTLISVTITTEAQTRTVKGTLFAGREPRFVDIKGISMDAKMGEHMLFLTNEDKPGFIGGLGTVLGDAGINVATFNLGRAEEGGEAMALVEVDQAVGEEVLDALRELPQVMRAQALRF